jgi:penicillin-binding protein-related factor A (putative recombinase)
MSESNFYKQLRVNTPEVLWTRIENRHGGGIPDLNGLYDGRDFWVELKITTTNKVRLSPTQISWHYNRGLYGGRSFILVKNTKTKEIKLFNNTDVRKLALEGFQSNSLIILRAPYDWKLLVRQF